MYCQQSLRVLMFSPSVPVMVQPVIIQQPPPPRALPPRRRNKYCCDYDVCECDDYYPWYSLYGKGMLWIYYTTTTQGLQMKWDVTTILMLSVGRHYVVLATMPSVGGWGHSVRTCTVIDKRTDL